jgi:hypothetical protein
MTLKHIRPGALAGARGPGEMLLGKSSTPKSRLFRSLGQTPRYVRWPIRNDDGHTVGHELLRIGPDLDHYLRRMAEEAK